MNFDLPYPILFLKSLPDNFGKLALKYSLRRLLYYNYTAPYPPVFRPPILTLPPVQYPLFCDIFTT